MPPETVCPGAAALGACAHLRTRLRLGSTKPHVRLLCHNLALHKIGARLGDLQLDRYLTRSSTIKRDGRHDTHHHAAPRRNRRAHRHGTRGERIGAHEKGQRCQ